MLRHDWEALLEGARSEALGFLEGLPGREIRPSATRDELREGLGGPLPEGPSDPSADYDVVWWIRARSGEGPVARLTVPGGLRSRGRVLRGRQ